MGGQDTDLFVMIRPDIRASRHNSMMRIILATTRRNDSQRLFPAVVRRLGGPLTELDGLAHSCSWESQRAEWLLRCVPVAIGDGESLASVGEDVNHGLENVLDLGDDETSLPLGVIWGYGYNA